MNNFINYCNNSDIPKLRKVDLSEVDNNIYSLCFTDACRKRRVDTPSLELIKFLLEHSEKIHPLTFSHCASIVCEDFELLELLLDRSNRLLNVHAYGKIINKLCRLQNIEGIKLVSSYFDKDVDATYCQIHIGMGFVKLCRLNNVPGVNLLINYKILFNDLANGIIATNDSIIAHNIFKKIDISRIHLYEFSRELIKKYKKSQKYVTICNAALDPFPEELKRSILTDLLGIL